MEDVRTGAVKQLTTDASDDIINGTSDWDNNEEFGLADCFHLEPGRQEDRLLSVRSKRRAGIRAHQLYRQLYPVITKYKYPKPGQMNSAVRLGVVNASAAAPRSGSRLPAIRAIPISRTWNGRTDGQVILQHMNRLQNTNTVFLANPDTGALRQMFQDKNDSWVEVNRNLRWIENGKRLLFTSERDGWRHLYAISRDWRRPADHQRAVRHGFALRGR